MSELKYYYLFLEVISQILHAFPTVINFFMFYRLGLIFYIHYMSYTGCSKTHDNEEDIDPRQSLIISTGKSKQGQASKHNHNIDETAQMRTESTGTLIHRSTKVINSEQLNRMTKSNE